MRESTNNPPNAKRAQNAPKSPQMVRFVIHGHLPDLNDYTRACRGNKYGANKVKQNAEALIRWCVHAQLRGWKTESPVHIRYRWVEKDRRHDKDNVAFAKKFVQDALVKAGVIPGDGWKWIVGYEDRFAVDKDNPRIEVEIVEVPEYAG